MNTDKLVILLSNHENQSKQLAGLKAAYDALDTYKVHVQLIAEGSIESFEVVAAEIAKPLAEEIQRLQAEVDDNADRIAKITKLLNDKESEKTE